MSGLPEDIGPAEKDGAVDVHGRNRLARNVLTNWGAQGVTIVSGFLLPRLIDARLGQVALGVWDLAWSIVVYFGLVQIGVTSSINRYVAFHRAQEDYAGINRVVSSVTMVMRVMGLVALSLSVFFAWAVGPLFRERLGGHLTEARWLVLLLGASLAVQISSTVYGSILTGCHRWDWHNGIQAAANVLALVGMVAALLLGQGLIGLAVANVAGEALGRSARLFMAYRLCPWLEIKRRHFDRAIAREMLKFGGKSLMTYIAQLLMNSSVSLLLAAYLGPAALALYQRPVALVRNLSVFVNKYAMVFSPTISSFQGAGRQDELRAMALQATRYGIFLSLPVLVLLLVFGGEVLRLWMGDRYANPLLVAVVVLAYFNQISYIPLYGALVGQNLHATYGFANVGGAATALLSSFVALSFFHGGILSVAVAVAVPVIAINGLYLPYYACRKMQIPAATFWREVWRAPVLCALPYAACLVVGRVFFGRGPAALAWVALGGVLLAAAYWRAALPERWKRRLLRSRQAVAP